MPAQRLFNRALSEFATAMKAVRPAGQFRVALRNSPQYQVKQIRDFHFSHPSIALCHGPSRRKEPGCEAKREKVRRQKPKRHRKSTMIRLSRHLRRTRHHRRGPACQSHRSRSSSVTQCLRSPISMCGGHTADRWTPSTPRWGIVRVIRYCLLARHGRAGAPLFLLTNYRRARSD